MNYKNRIRKTFVLKQFGVYLLSKYNKNNIKIYELGTHFGMIRKNDCKKQIFHWVK